MPTKPYNINKLDNPQDIGRLDNLLNIIFNQLNNMGFVDRGNGTGFDFDETDVTMDGTWKTDALDFSAIVPEGAKAIVLRMSMTDATVGAYIRLRTAENTDESYNVSELITQVANKYTGGDFIIPLPTSRKLDFFASEAITGISIFCKGWFI